MKPILSGAGRPDSGNVQPRPVLLDRSCREGIAAVAALVFDTMLHLPLEAAASEAEMPPGLFTAAVHYAGGDPANRREPAAGPPHSAPRHASGWKGALLLECTREQAQDWTARLMGLATPPEGGDLRDGLGELANVIGGNLKPLLPSGVGLSLPTVVEGSDYRLCVCGRYAAETVHLADPTGPFRITLLAFGD